MLRRVAACTRAPQGLDAAFAVAGTFAVVREQSEKQTLLFLIGPEPCKALFARAVSPSATDDEPLAVLPTPSAVLPGPPALLPVPSAVAFVPFASALKPTAVALVCPLAVAPAWAPQPSAVVPLLVKPLPSVPPASAPAPKAELLSPVAVLNWPNAEATSAFAVAPCPIDVLPLPLAEAVLPDGGGGRTRGHAALADGHGIGRVGNCTVTNSRRVDLAVA
jgi:hypothetical protein